MSYILDALKKSERQRPPGPVPDLFTVHGPQPVVPRRPARAIAAVAALLLGPAAIALWVWPGSGRRDGGVARPPGVDSPQPRAAVPAAPATPRASAAPTPPVPVRAAAGTGARRSVDEWSQAPAAGPAVPNPVLPTPVTSVPVSPSPPRLGGDTGSALSPASATPSGGIPAPTLVPAPGAEPKLLPVPVPGPVPSPVPTAVPVLEATSVASRPEEIPPADGRVLNPEELPASIRAQLPKLIVSGHVWSEDPSLRLLSVDDRLLREGGDAAPGVRLQEITAAGAVFVFNGWRFRVAGGRP